MIINTNYKLKQWCSKPSIRLFSLRKKKLSKMRTFEFCKSRIFVFVQELYKEFEL